MYNITIHKNIFHRYLLGESLKHIFIRLIFILLIIIIIWCCIIIILIHYIKYCKRKQIENITLNSTRNNLKQKYSYWTRITRNSLQTQTTTELMSKRSSLLIKRVDSKNDLQNNEQEFNTKLPHFSNINFNRSFLIKKDLTSTKQRHASLNDADNIEKHLPLVMITDTNLSFTSIVELETFEDKYRLMTDIEQRITRQLKASYRPRYST
jgi:hypothetical protein